jgi:hypothetical protein
MILIFSKSVLAYVPSVESIFRHGNNPEVTTNALMLAAKISAVNPFLEKNEQQQGESMWVKWVYNITPQGKLKLTQLIYRSAAMTEASLIDKTFISELTPQIFAGDSPEKIERGLLLSLFNSMLINDGSFMVEFLKNRGEPVKLNAEIINQEKRSILSRYKAWLIKKKGGRIERSEESPLLPLNAVEKEKVESILSSPMYEQSPYISLSRYQGSPAWHVKTENFEGWVSDETRFIRHLGLKSGAFETEIQCRDHILFNGTHSLPRQILIKSQQDIYWQIDIITLKHFSETTTDLLARLRQYDQILQQNRVQITRPAFLY